MNGKTLEVDVSPLAIGKDVIDVMCKMFKLRENSKMFQLFIAEGLNSVIVNANSRILDITNQMTQSMKLQFAVAYYFSVDLYNPQAVELVYYQCVYDIQIGKYFRKEVDYYNVIALILQEQLQDYSGDNRLLW